MARRLAAIMFTDVVGFTASAQEDEGGALERLHEQERIVRSLRSRYGGREIKSTGDGLLVEFESALRATECALEIQRHLRERNARALGPPLRLRIGIHVGDVEEEGGDILGDTVNIAARLVPLAEPGGVCLSEHVVAHVRSKVLRPLEKLGPQELKGVREPLDVYRVVLDGGTEGTLPQAALGPRLAVLPLTNMSPDPEDEYFSDGMTEELISTLSTMPDLLVISRTSVMPYKRQPKLMVEIGRELKVDNVLEGSVRKSGEQVRIAIQLIEAATDRHLWGETFDRRLGDIFSTQSEIAEKVATALHLRLVDTARHRWTRAITHDPWAHMFYLKALFHMERATNEEYEIALDYLEQAVGRDPGYATAYAAMADLYSELGTREIISHREAYAKAETFARRALDLDETLAEAHLTLAWVLEASRDMNGAAKESQRAFDLNPNLPWAHLTMAHRYVHEGRWEEARRAAERALELDPRSESTMAGAASWLLTAGDAERASALYAKLIEIDPSNPSAWHGLGMSHVEQGKYDAGIAEIRKGLAMSTAYQPDRESGLACALSRAGRMDEAHGILSKLIRHHEEHGSGALPVAEVYASLGEREAALKWLEMADREQSPFLHGLDLSPAFAGMRSDPAFQEVLQRTQGLRLVGREPRSGPE